MNKISKIILIYLSLLNIFSHTILAQSINEESNLEQLFENSDQTGYSESQMEYLEYRKANKLNLYFATINDLIEFPEFDPIISKKILDYVQNHPDYSITKLTKDLNLTGSQLLILEYCTFIKKDVTPDKFNLRTRFKLNNTNDDIYGFEKSKFTGNKLDYSSRTYLAYNSFNSGLILDKDAGEPNTIDYLSAFVNYKNRYLNIIAGDFSYEIGMGNILWREFPDRKGIDVLAPTVRFGDGAIPYRSTLDFSLFRGLALDYNVIINSKSKILLSGFASKKQMSATYDSTNNLISSIYTMGLYRTETEKSKKNVLNETAFGGFMTYSWNNLNVGAGFLSLNYDYNIQSSSASAFVGKNGILKTFFANYIDTNFSVATEISLDANNNIGGKIGSVLDFNKLSLSIHFRTFDANFRSPYGRIFGEFSYPANELGLFSGLRYKMNKNNILSSYLDIFKTYGRTYNVDDIVHGFTFFTQYDYHLKRNLSGLLRLTYENKTDSKNQIIYQKQKYSLRTDFSYNITRNFFTRFRFEFCYLNFEQAIKDEIGIANFVELFYQLDGLKVFSRFSIYSTDSYDSAIWQYEYFINGTLYSFPAYLQGSRIIAGIKYDISNFLYLNFLYSNTSKNNSNTLSSGYDQILANYSNNFIFQIEVNFK